MPSSMNGPLMSRNTLKELIQGPEFGYGAEVVTTRGMAAPQEPDKLIEFAQRLLDNPRISWISICDNPGGHPMLPPDWLGRASERDKSRMVFHMTCKDRNRNDLESIAWKYASEGFHNMLAMTGDYPTDGYCGNASPVFDWDSTNLITLLRSMNDGLQIPGRRGDTITLPQTDFFIGCAVSPFKRHERELMTQYMKLNRKIQAGAHYAITQLGYDMRKFHEVKCWLAYNNLDFPVVGYVYLLNKVVAGIFNRNQIPGCVVSDKLLEEAKKYAAGEDKGRGFFRELAAKQLAVFKGIGFTAGYIGGITKDEIFSEVIDKAESFAENDWKDFVHEIHFPQPDEFYLFEPDEQTGLGNSGAINRAYTESLARPTRTRRVTLGYRFSRRMHDKVFSPEACMFKLMKRIYTRWDTKPGLLARLARFKEKLSKFIGYGCRDCGDCSLPDCGYLCPVSQCSKNMRNGPCGGSADGMCEVGDKECIWARAYDRFKYHRESEQMFKGPVVSYNAQLKDTSAWANTFLGRDHFGFGREAAEKTGDK